MLKWEIGYRNLLLYSLCMPSYEPDEKDDTTPGNGKVVDMFEYFEGLGKG